LRKAIKVLGSGKFFEGENREAVLDVIADNDLLGSPSAAEEGFIFDLVEQAEKPLGQATIVLKNCSGFMLRHQWENAKEADPTKAIYHSLALKYLEYQHNASAS